MKEKAKDQCYALSIIKDKSKRARASNSPMKYLRVFELSFLYNKIETIITPIPTAVETIIRIKIK